MSEPLLEVRNLGHRFQDGTWGLRAINLTVERGEFLLLTGRNGSGKTILARHLNGLYSPTEGAVFLYGKNIKDDIVHTRRKIGLVFQEAASQIVGMTVEEDVAFGPENLGLPEEDVMRKTDEALRLTGMERFREHKPHTLSGGEKRRLTIAGVLAMDPDIIILDEPFTGLDYPASVMLLKTLCSLHEEGKTIIVITHELEKILAHADSVVVMEAGTLACRGTPEEILPVLETHGVRKPRGGREDIGTMTWLG